MGILDRLKPQPRWKHSDPTVRRQAIQELEDAAELAALAERDPDASVRTAALAKVADTEVLGRVSASDADREVRELAADRLLAMALDASQPGTVAAAALLTDVRRLSQVARSTAADVVREAALARIAEERALGGVARQAKVESTAFAALARLVSTEELMSTALNSEHRDVALAAFERIAPEGKGEAEVALLRSVEARAQQKAVARRAKAMLQVIQDEEDARRLAEEERQKRESALATEVGKLAALADPDRIDAELARLGAEWDGMPHLDPYELRRYEAGVSAARERAALRRREIEAALEEERRRLAATAVREELCRRVEAIEADSRGEADGAGIPERLFAVEEEWARLEPAVGYEREVAALASRFTAAADACRRRLALEASLLEARAALEAIVVEAETLGTEEGSDAAGRWRALSRDARGPASTLDAASKPATDLLERLEAVGKVFEARENEAREAAAKAGKEYANRLGQLLLRAERVSAAETITLREGEKLVRDLTAALAADAVPAGEAAKTLAAIRALEEPIARRVKELRDLDEWRRFGNLQRQEELIATVEALVAHLKSEEEAGIPSDLAVAAKALRDAQAAWQPVAEGPRQGGTRTWERFKTAMDELRSRCEVHFVQLREQRAASLAARTAIVEEAEALAGSTEWVKTATRLQEMQKAWDETGPVPGETGRRLAQRFRIACNAFFTRRREDLNTRKTEWAANLARKEALCERAEQLAESTDWDEAASELKRMQVEWKAIGPVQHSVSEAVWKRFRAAADTFFARYQGRHAAAAAAQLAEHEALVVALESLAALEEAPDDLAAQVQSLRTSIANAPEVGGPAAAALYKRWIAALGTLVSRFAPAFAGTDLDAIGTRARLEKIVAKIESLAGEETPGEAGGKAKTTTEILAERLRSALEKNALGVRPDEAKWRAAGRAVEEAREAWDRLAWLPGFDKGDLEARFEAACARVRRQVKQHVGSADPRPGDFGGRGPSRGPSRRPRGGGRDGSAGRSE